MIFGGYGLYILFSLPALLLGFWAQTKVKSAYKKYSRIRNYSGLSGAEVARKFLDNNGMFDVDIEMVQGFLSDHYDPRKKVLRLSPDVYRGNTIAAAGIAAHEAGHAMQDKKGYLPLKLRSAMVPTVQIGSWIGPLVFFLGLFLAPMIGEGLAWIGLLFFAGTALFAFVTLPVEFDATKRAKAWLTNSGLIYQEEKKGIDKVLDAAALTYVAGAIQALTTVLYYAFLLTGNRRR